MKITEDQVMEVIESFGAMGATKKQIAKKLGTAIETPTYRAEQLIKAGLVLKGKHGLEVVYIAKPKVPKIPYPEPKPIQIENMGFLAAMQEADDGVRGGVPPVYELKKEIVVKKSELDKLVNEFVSALASSVVERLRPMIVEKLSNSVATMTAEIASNVENVKEKIKLPSILVGGLHPDQTKMIEKEFEGVADLRFVGADESNAVWKSRAANAQHTLLMVDFLSHKHIETVKATGVVPIILRGGLTKMRDKLMELSV